MVAMSPELWIFGAAGLISLLAFAGLILVPAVGSFGRVWEKLTATLLSVIVLVALVGIGVAIGVVVVYYWPQISSLLS